MHQISENATQLPVFTCAQKLPWRDYLREEDRELLVQSYFDRDRTQEMRKLENFKIEKDITVSTQSGLLHLSDTTSSMETCLIFPLCFLVL